MAPPASLTPPASSISCMPRRPAERACSRTSALPVGDAPELALCRGGGAEGAAGGSDAPRGVEVRSRSRVHRKPAPGHCLVWSDDADAPSQTPPFSALMGEVEAVSKAFEQLQEQNEQQQPPPFAVAPPPLPPPAPAVLAVVAPALECQTLAEVPALTTFQTACPGTDPSPVASQFSQCG